MDTLLVSHRAKWASGELLTVVVMAAIGIIGLFLGFTQIINTVFGIIIGVIGLAIALYAAFMSLGRKKNSTLYAKLGNDKNLNIEVWMKKPMKEKWHGKLDQGKNKGKLINLNSVDLETIRGTRVVVLKLTNGKPVTLPVRLAEVKEVKEYLAQAVKANGNKLTFESQEKATEFGNIISTKTESAKASSVKTSNTKIEEDADLAEDAEDYTAKLETEKQAQPEVLEKEFSTPEPEVPTRPRVRIDYSQYRIVSQSEIINNAIDAAEEKQLEERLAKEKEEAQAPAASITDLSSIFGGASNASIDVDLGTSKKEDE